MAQSLRAQRKEGSAALVLGSILVASGGMCELCGRSGPPKREGPPQKNYRVNGEKKFFMNLNHIHKIIFR